MLGSDTGIRAQTITQSSCSGRYMIYNINVCVYPVWWTRSIKHFYSTVTVIGAVWEPLPVRESRRLSSVHLILKLIFPAPPHLPGFPPREVVRPREPLMKHHMDALRDDAVVLKVFFVLFFVSDLKPVFFFLSLSLSLVPDGEGTHSSWWLSTWFLGMQVSSVKARLTDWIEAAG